MLKKKNIQLEKSDDLSSRIIELAKPRHPRKKYRPLRRSRSKKSIEIIKTNPLSTRLEELAYPFVRYVAY